MFRFLNSAPIKRGLLAMVAVVALLAAAAPAMANDVNVTKGWTLAGGPLAIHGYDAVAFFSEGKARVGHADYSFNYKGSVYRFVSESNKQTFAKAPERYAPQYGGYCAYGTALGKKFDGDPTLFTVVEGKLYFNLNPDILKKWREDIPGNITKADRQWKTIRHNAPADLM